MSVVRVRSIGPGDAPGSVVEVTMANAERRNSLGAQMLAGLDAALAAATADGCRALVLRAEPGVSTWSAGYDIESLPTDGADPLRWSNPLDDLLRTLRDVPFPVIAAVEGGVWGGACELALTCDLVVATRTATFAITPARLGVAYSTAGVARFLAALPANVVRELFFTADPLGAAELAGHGVVNRLVEDAAELTAVATDLGRRIALRAPLTVRSVKAEVNAQTAARALTDDELDRLTGLRQAAWTSADYAEGVRAFREKRAPRFTGA